MKLVWGGYFKLIQGMITLKPSGTLLVFFMFRVVGKCVPGLY